MCLFNIDDYDCRETLAKLCLQLLQEMCTDPWTGDQHKKHICECAERIVTKDKNGRFGRKAMELCRRYSDEGKSVVPPPVIEGSFTDYQDLTDLILETWKAFVDAHKHQINPVHLLQHLTDRWEAKRNRMDDPLLPRNRKTAKEVHAIAEFVRETYKNSNSGLSHMFSGLDEDTGGIEQRALENGAMEKAKTVETNKDWYTLLQQLKPFIKSESSPEFREFVSDRLKKAEDGVGWLKSKSDLIRCTRMISPRDLDLTDESVKELQARKHEILALYSNKHIFGKPDDLAQLEEASEKVYREIPGALPVDLKLEDLYQKIRLWEDKLRDFFPHIPAEWADFKDRQEKAVVEEKKEEIETVLKEEKDAAEVLNRIDHLESWAKLIGLSKGKMDELQDYIRGVKETLLNVQILHDKIKEIEAFDDPWHVGEEKKIVEELEKRLKELPQHHREWASVKKVEGKWSSEGNLIKAVQAITTGLKDLSDIVRHESRKVFCNDTTLDILQFRDKIDLPARRQRACLNRDEHDGIKYLETLGDHIKLLKDVVFGDADATFPAQRGDEFVDFVIEDIKRGDALLADLVAVNREDDVDVRHLVKRFFNALETYRDRSFILRTGIDRAVVDALNWFAEAVGDMAASIIVPIKNELQRFFPLSTPGKLRDYMETLRHLSEAAEVIRQNEGFENLSQSFAPLLPQLDRTARVHLFIHDRQFRRAAGLLKKGEGDADTGDLAADNRLKGQIYFYENLDGKKWNPGNWLYFFNTFGHESLDLTAVFKKYETQFEEKLETISPDHLKPHFTAYHRYGPEGNCHPFLNYICNPTKEVLDRLFEALEERKALRNYLPFFLNYIKKYLMWNKYVTLYMRISTEDAARIGEESPGAVYESLEDHYRRIRNEFEHGEMRKQEFQSIFQLIIAPGGYEPGREEFLPDTPEFREWRERYSDLEDIVKLYPGINRQFVEITGKDIWSDDDFPQKLAKLKEECSRFRGGFTGIRISGKWDEIIGYLRALYKTGRNIFEHFNLVETYNRRGDLRELGFVNHRKGTEQFSQKFVSFLEKALELWNRFHKEVEHLVREISALQDSSQPGQLRTIFDDHYLNPLIDKWRAVGILRFWEEDDGEKIAHIDGFFEILGQVLENHNKFLIHQQDRESPNPRVSREEVRILDPCIKSTFERWDHVDRLKKGDG